MVGSHWRLAGVSVCQAGDDISALAAAVGFDAEAPAPGPAPKKRSASSRGGTTKKVRCISIAIMRGTRTTSSISVAYGCRRNPLRQ